MKDLDYTTANYGVSIELAKSPNDVFNHLIDLSKWWPEDFQGEEIKPGSEFILKTGDGHFSKNKVVEFAPGKKLVWITTESKRNADNFDWSGTKFIFELIAKGNITELRFTYNGVVLENESDRLAHVCDMCVKELFYNFIIDGKQKLHSHH